MLESEGKIFDILNFYHSINENIKKAVIILKTMAANVFMGTDHYLIITNFPNPLVKNLSAT